MNAWDINVCIRFLTCCGMLPQLDSDEEGAVLGILDPTGQYRWYLTSENHVSGFAGVPKRVGVT